MQKNATETEERKQLEDELAQTRSQLNEADAKVQLVRGEMNALKRLDAPCDGFVLGAPRPEDVDKFWEKGQPVPFCMIGDPKELRLLVPVPPADYHVLQRDMADGRRLAVSIHFPGRGAEVVVGQVTRLPESDAKDVPLQLTQRGGGPLAVKPASDPNVQVPQSQQYLVPVELFTPDRAIVAGTMANVKIHCRWRSGAWWVWHKISSAFDLGLI